MDTNALDAAQSDTGLPEWINSKVSDAICQCRDYVSGAQHTAKFSPFAVAENWTSHI